MPQTPERKIRKDADFVRATLDALDQSSGESKSIGPRRAERFKYRVTSILVEFPTDRGVWQSHCVTSRNISRNGVGFVVGQFVYPGSVCRVHLRTIHNSTHVCTGKVTRCRYLSGTGTLHEVGVKFDAPVDIVMFTRGAQDTRVLLVDDDPELFRIAERMLKSCGVELMHVPNAEQALERAQAERFTIVMLKLELPGTNGLELVRSLRQAGYMRPIVALTSDDNEQTRARCLEGGFTTVLTKPFTRASLEGTIASLQESPLISSLIHDTDMAEFIDSFVEGLHDDIQALERAFVSKELTALQTLTRELKGSAGTHGFDMISTAAAEIETALNGQPDLSDVRDKLTRLVRLCLAARPATARAIER